MMKIVGKSRSNVDSYEHAGMVLCVLCKEERFLYCSLNVTKRCRDDLSIGAETSVQRTINEACEARLSAA